MCVSADGRDNGKGKLELAMPRRRLVGDFLDMEQQHAIVDYLCGSGGGSQDPKPSSTPMVVVSASATAGVSSWPALLHHWPIGRLCLLLVDVVCSPDAAGMEPLLRRRQDCRSHLPDRTTVAYQWLEKHVADESVSDEGFIG